MNTANHISPEDLTLIALQLLPEEEMNDALTHLEHCEACRNELAALQGDLAVYALTSEMHSPPALARERLMKSVAKEKKVVSIERPQVQERTLPLDTVPPPPPVTLSPEEPVLSSRSRGMFESYEAPEEPVRRSGRVTSIAAWTGWAIAAGIGVVAGLQFHQRQALQNSLNTANTKLTASATATDKAEEVLRTLTSQGALQVMMHIQPPDGVPVTHLPEGRAAYDQASGSLVFVASNLLPVPQGKTYELWVLPADSKAAPIPSGTFRPDDKGNATVMMPEIPKGVVAQGFGVTMENAGGSKTPTLPIILSGTEQNGI
jgi:hypothetical protein